MSAKNFAAVFPGQGSQSVGMGKELFDNFKVYQSCIEEASDTLSLDFKKLCFEGPEETLRLTENTQPAIVTASVGALRVLESETDFKPSYTAGHSVGEYSALVAAGVLSFKDAVSSVKLRGKAMQESVPVGEGAMSALLGPSDEQAVELCKWVESQDASYILETANFNCPGQVVLSGNTQAMDWLKENIATYELEPKPRKVRLMPLKVSAPFHCRLMKPAEEVMKAHLESIEFKTPKFKFIQNVTAKEVSDPSEIRKNLISQVSGSVLWTKSILEVKNASISSYLELGSGATLSGLIKKIDTSDLNLFNTSKMENLNEFLSWFS